MEKKDRLTFKDFKKRALRNPDVKREYDALKPIFDLRRQLIDMRIEKGLTQADIAREMGTHKSNISRLECGASPTYPNLATIEKYADALGYKMEINFTASKKTA